MSTMASEGRAIMVGVNKFDLLDASASQAGATLTCGDEDAGCARMPMAEQST